MTDARLKSLAERIERLMDERDGIQADIRDIYTEAKSAGYVPKVLRKAITRKRMDPSKRDEEDAILGLYEGALDGKTRAVRDEIAKGATLDATAEKTGVPRRTVARLAKTVPEKIQSGTADMPPHDADGVIKESTADPAEGAAGTSLPPNNAPQAERTQMPPATPAPEGGVGAGTHSELAAARIGRAGDSTLLSKNGAVPVETDAASCLRTSEAAGTPMCTAAAGTAGVESGPQDPDDDLAFPTFLDRRLKQVSP